MDKQSRELFEAAYKKIYPNEYLHWNESKSPKHESNYANNHTVDRHKLWQAATKQTADEIKQLDFEYSELESEKEYLDNGLILAESQIESLQAENKDLKESGEVQFCATLMDSVRNKNIEISALQAEIEQLKNPWVSVDYAHTGDADFEYVVQSGDDVYMDILRIDSNENAWFDSDHPDKRVEFFMPKPDPKPPTA